MSDRIQQLVGLIQTLLLLKSTSEEAANVFEKVIQSKANAHEGGLAGYLKEITADAKTATTTLAILEKEIKAVSALPVRAAADETLTSEGTRPAPVVSDAARKRKEVQDRIDDERKALRTEVRGNNRPTVVNVHTDRLKNYELLLAQLDEQIDEREDTLRDLIRRTQTKMRTPAKTSRSSSPVADPEYADMKWALTTPDTRSATSYAVTPNRGGRVSVAQSGGARPPENASVSAIVKYVNTQLRHENPAETRPEIAPIVAELQKLVKDREEATVPADKNRINQQIKQAFKKINQSSGTVSNTQRQTAQESIIAPIIEALRAVKLDDPTLNAAMSPVASSSEIESALTRAVEMLVTRLENGAAGRVGETALSTEGFEFLRPAAFDQLLKRLKTVVAEATTRPVIPRSRTVDPGTAEEVDSSALFLGTDFSIQNAGEDGSPQVVDALRSSRVFPGQVTRIGANISKYIQSLKASLNPTRRYSSEAQGVDVRAGSQVVAGSSSAVFGGGMDAEVQKAVDALFSTVMQDIEEGNIRPASIAGQTVDLPESLAKMVVEAIQSSSILSEHTTAFGRMAGTRGPRGAIVTGDPVRKFVALFAGDLINQYTSTGAVSDQSASRFVEQTVAPEQEQEVTLAATHAKRLRERLVYQRDQADLSMVTAAPAMANRYRTESAKLGKEIQLLDEILAESENPEEEKKLAQRRGQIALPGSNTAPALTRDQALTVLFKQSIGSIPATPDAVAPIISKAQEVSAGLAQSGLTIPARPSYGTSPVQSLVEYMTSGQSMALDRYQTTPITQQLDSAGKVSSGQQNREFIEIISDAFGLSRQSASAGNVITGLYHGARATDASGKMLEGEELDQSLGGGYRTKKGLQSIVQASAEMGSYGSGGIPLIEYAKLATSTDLDAEEQSLFQEVQAKLPHLQAIDSDSLKQLAELDTSMDPKELIKRVLTLAAPAIKNQIVASIRRRGGAAGMGVDEVTQMISDYETAGVAPAGFQDEFRALAMFDPANINTTDVSAAVNRSLSLFSNLLTDNVQSGEGMPQFAARVLGRQDRLVGTGPDVAAAVPDQGASYSLMGKGAEVANQESGQVVGGTYGRNVENQIKIQEAMSEFEQLTAEIEEMQRRIALAPHEADKVLPVIEQKNNQLKILKQKLDTYKASEPDPISQKFEALSTIAQMDNIDPATRSAAIYDLGIMQEIFNQTGRYQIDESQGYGTGTQEQRLTNLMAHKAKLDRLQKLREERAALEAESPGDGPAKAVEAVIKESDVDGEIAAVTKDISDMKSEGTGSEKKVDASPYANMNMTELEDLYQRSYQKYDRAMSAVPGIEEATQRYHNYEGEDDEQELEILVKALEGARENNPEVAKLYQEHQAVSDEYERRIKANIENNRAIQEKLSPAETSVMATSVPGTIDEEIAIDENAVPLKIPRINLTESKDITDDVTAEDKSVFVHPATVEAQLIESPAFTAFLAGKENQIISGNQDRLAIRQDAETGALTAAVADGASSSWFSARLANMLAEEAVNLPTDEPFTTESILSRVNNRSAQEQVDKILEYFTDEDYQTRYQLQRMGLEKNDKSKEKFKKFLQPFEEAGTSPTVRELIAFLHGEKAANDPANIGQVAGATFAGYRRTRSSEGYKHEFLTAGDALIESADLGIAKETLGENKTNPDGTPYTGPQTAGIISTESGIAHPGKVLTIESKTPARVFLASDAYSHSGEFSRLDPEVDAGGFVNLGERLLLDEGELGTRQDDRSFIGITGSEQTGPVVKTGGLAEEGFTGLEFTDQLEAYLAQEKRKLSQINQLLTDRPDIDKELERERQALLKSAEAEVEQQGQLAEEITNTHRAIADEYDAVVDRLMKNRYAGPEEKAQDSEKHRKLAQTPEMQEVLKARREAFKAEQKYKQIVAENPPTSAEKAKVVTENNIQALTEELTKRGVILPTETTPTAETVIPVTDVTSVAEEPKRIADEPVKVSAEIKASPEEIQKRKADLDLQIAEAAREAAQSQQVIELMQRQAQGLDTEDSDIRFVVDNTGIPVSYEDKQVIDRTSLRPLVRTKMTVDDTGESGFVSNLNVRDIVDQAEAVKPTAELMDEIGKMSDADLAAVKMPSKVLTDEEKEKYQYLRQASKQAKEEARKIYEADTPLGEAIRKYYRITNVEERDRMTLGDIGSPAIPGLKEAVAEYELQRGISLGSDEQTGKLGKASEATPLQLAARLFRSSRAAVRAYETEFGVEPAFSAREVMDELLASSARAEVDSAPAGSAETAVALDKTISSFEGGIPEIKGSTDRAPRRPRRAPADVVADVEQPYTENQLKYARAQVRALAGRTDLTAEQKRQLSEARKKLHNYAMKRLTTNFGDNKGVMQIANVVAGLTPPDWAKDDVQSARVSAISQAMADLKPGQLAKLKDVDLRDPVQMDILSKDPALQPIMALLADQDIDAALKYRSGTTEYDEAKGLLSAIEGAKKRLPVPEPTAGVPTDARRLFFDLETNFAKKPEDRLIFQAATGVNDGKVSDMYAVPLDSSAEEINRIAVDPTIPDDEKRKLIRELALKRAGKPPLVEGRASGNDVSSGVIDNLVNAAMSGRQILTQGQIRGDLQSQILAATTVAGHNIETFDLPTVYGGEMAVPDAVKAKTEDTLLMSRNMYPGSHTLSDTYEVVTGDPLVNAHDARADTEAVQRIFPQVSDPEERAKITEAYLAKHGITMDSAVGQLVATPKIADIADTEERKKASRQVAEAHAFYQPLADMQDFTRRIAKSGGKTILRDADKTVAAEQGWYDMSPAAKASLFERMNKMFVGHTKLKGKKIEELDDAELGEFVKEINATYLEPNADAAVGGDFGGMKRLLEEKVGGKMAFSDFRTPAERLAAIKGRTIEDVMSTAGSSGVKVGPAISKETVGDAIEDISLATERPTKVKTPGSAPSVTASTSDGGSKEPPREPPVTFSDDADSGERGGPGGGITTIASATIDTLHAGAVEINIHGGNVTIDANFSAGAAEKMQKSLVYISNKDGMNVNGDVTSVGTGGGGGGYRRVSVADRSILNQLDAAKNQIAGQLQTETDPATRERLRGNLNEVSRQAIRAIIEPKVKAIDSEGMEPYVNERFYYGDETTDSKESLTYYNDAVAQAHQDLTTQLEAQQAIPEGTDGRDEEIQRIQKQISLVEELINALTELNQAEQRVGSATSTRAIVDPTEVKKPAYPTNNSGYRKLSPEDRASLAVLDATKNSISEQLRTEQDPEARARLKETLTGASKKAIADIIKPKATKLLGYGFVNTVDALSTSPEDSLVNYSQAAQSKLSELNGRLFMIESEREDAPGREEAIERTKREIQQVHELIDALTELNQAEQRVGAAGATRNAESPYGPKPTADPRAGANKYRKVSFADQASFNVLESTKNEVSARLRDETDSAARDALRQSLVNASERAINEVIKPKAAKVLNPTQLAALSALPMGPEEALVSYNEMAQYNLNNLSTELATQEALPEGTSGRDTEIERLKAEIAAVEELINALTELNAIEQRVGSASGTRNVNSPYGTTSGTGTGTSASKYYSRKAKEDEQVFLQLARNSFDQSAGSMGIAGGTTADSRKFLTDLTRSTATTMINSSGIQAPGMAADIAAIAATSPEVQSAYDDAAKSLTDFSGKVGGTITDVADDLFTVVSGLVKLKAALTPIAATSPQAAAALAVVQTAIDETSAAGKEQRGTAGVIETDNRKKVSLVEEQMQAAASRPGFFAGGRREREMRQIQEGYIRDTFGKEGLDALMHRGRIRAYTATGKRVDMAQATVQEQRDTVERLQKQGINITAEDMTGIARMSGRVEQTKRSAPMGDKLFYAASKIRDTQSVVQAAVDTVTSLANIPQMAGGMIQQFASSATGSNRVMTTARGLALDPENYTAALNAADMQRKQFGGSLTSNLGQVTSFIPLSNAYGVDIGKSVKVARKLAAFDPAQGMEGAGIAIKEFLSGNVSSLSRRFEINRSALSKINTGDATQMLDSLDQLLSSMGVTDRLIDEQANSMATKYDKMIGNLESVQISSTTAIVDFITPALESLIGEQSYFGKNVKERSLNTVLKETITSYGDDILSDPEAGLDSVNIGGSLSTFTSQMDTILEAANKRMAGEAGRYNSATGASVSVPGYRLLGNMKPQERANIQFDALLGQAQGLNATQAIMQAMRNNPGDYNSSPEFLNQRESLKTRQVKVDPVAYAEAYKKAEAGLLVADQGATDLSGLGLGYINFNAEPVKEKPLMTKGRVRRQVDADTFDIEIPGRKDLVRVRTGVIDAQEKGTQDELAARVGGADIIGMDRAMIGGEYKPGQGPEITLVGTLKNIDENNRVVAQLLNSEGKNYSLEMIATGNASSAFMQGLDKQTIDSLAYIEKVVADNGVGPQNRIARDLNLGGAPEISEEVRSSYFWNKYGLGIGGSAIAGGAAGLGGAALATNATLGTAGLAGLGGLVAAEIAAAIALPAVAAVGLYAGGAYVSDRLDSSPEKMRELYKMQSDLDRQDAKMNIFNTFADQANLNAEQVGKYVGGAKYRSDMPSKEIVLTPGFGPGAPIIPGTAPTKTAFEIMQDSKASLGQVYLANYEEASKSGQERFATAGDATKRILERQVYDPVSETMMSYVDYEAQTIALKKTADVDPTAYRKFDAMRGEILKPIGQTGALIENEKLVERGIKYGTRLDKRALAEAEASPFRADVADLTKKRDDAFNAGAVAEGQRYKTQIDKANAEIEKITYTDAEWDKIPEAARYLIMSAEEVANMTAEEIRFAADQTYQQGLNPVDYKQEAKNFFDGTMDRNFQRRQQRVDTTLTAFARQSIMGLGDASALPNDIARQVVNSGGAGVIDNTPEARAVRMVGRSGLMPKNRDSALDTVAMLTEAQRAAVREQLDIARTNRQVALANAPEAQLYKSGFTNFVMAMNKAGATAEDLGRSFMNTMNMMSEGNPRYGLDLAQQMTGFSYEAMIGMQLRPRTGVDAEGNPISSLNGANGMPYGYNAKPGEIISGPMVMPYTSGPRGTIAYSRDMMAVGANGVREGALGIAPSQWQQFVSNATNANAELQRRAMSNAMQERDLNKNHQRNLEDITRNGMRQLESIHLNYTRNMQQMTMQADLVKGATRANATRSIAMAAIDPTSKAALNSQYWAQDMYSQHLGQGDSKNFLKDSANIATLTAIDPSLSADISALETTNAAYESSAITDPNRQNLQDAKRATIEPILTKLRGLIETEEDPIKKAALQTALVRLSPDASKTIAAQTENDKWLKQTLGDKITQKQLGQQIADQEFQNQFRPLDIANDSASLAEAGKSKDPLAFLNAKRSSLSMYRGFAQSDIGLAETTNSLTGLLGTGSLFETNTTEAFKQIAEVAGSATQGVLYSLDDFETSFQQQMEDALRNFERQRLDMIQAFADAAVEIASIVPEEMVPIMQATSAFMNTQRQAELLWLSGRTDEANALAYQGMLKLGEVVYGEGKGKEYADKYSQNFQDMADVAARDVPQGDLGKFAVKTEDGWALLVKETKSARVYDRPPPNKDKETLNQGNGPFVAPGGKG